MQIERIYKPDIRCQMHAIMLMLRIRIPYEPATSVTKKEEVPQQSTHSTGKSVHHE